VNVRNLWLQHYRAKLIADTSQLALQLGDRRTYGFPADPNPSDVNELASRAEEAKPEGLRLYVDSDPGDEIAARALRNLLQLEQETHVAAGDPALTEYGRAQRLENPRAHAVIMMSHDYHAAQEHLKTVAQRERSLYGWSEIARGDFETSFADREIRDWLRTRGAQERTQLLDEIARGEAERITLALLRSPIPLGIEEQLAHDAWRAAVRKSQPQAVEQVERAQQTAEWAASVVRECARQVRILTRMDAYAIYGLATSEAWPAGVYAWGFTPAELAQFTRRRDAERSAALQAGISGAEATSAAHLSRQIKPDTSAELEHRLGERQ
jgi:hypothetical protein